jgi:hypothetical protein
VDDSLAASSVIVVLLDNGRALGRLTLLDHGAIAVAVRVPVALANAYASSNGPNVDTDIIRQRGCGKRRNGGNYQQTLHGNLLLLTRKDEQAIS